MLFYSFSSFELCVVVVLFVCLFVLFFRIFILEIVNRSVEIGFRLIGCCESTL